MRTAPAPSSNKITQTTTKIASATKRLADDEQSPFDQILQKRNAPKREESNGADAEGPPKKADRSSKRAASPTKARASKDKTNETDPDNPAICARQPEQKKGEANVSDDAEQADAESSETPVDALATDGQPDDHAAPKQQQVVNVGVAVEVPADATSGAVAKVDENGAREQPQAATAVEAGEPKAPELRSPDARPTKAVEPHSETVGKATATTGFEIPATDDADASTDQQPTPPQAGDTAAVKKSPAKESPSVETTLPTTDALGAKPVKQQKPTDGESNNPSSGGERAANVQLATNVPEDPESTDDTTGNLNLDAALSADAKPASHVNTDPDVSLLNEMKPAPTPHAQPVATAQPARPPEAAFAADNHANIVTSVRTNLLPNGGTMQIRLNPPELGAIQVAVQMRDGVMNASFETTSDQATRLLSHSLGELRTSLENSGVAVDKLHVEQAPRDQNAQSHANDDRQQQRQAQDSPGRRDQERRELLQRMWRKLSEGSDPLDMVA